LLALHVQSGELVTGRELPDSTGGGRGVGRQGVMVDPVGDDSNLGTERGGRQGRADGGQHLRGVGPGQTADRVLGRFDVLVEVVAGGGTNTGRGHGRGYLRVGDGAVLGHRVQHRQDSLTPAADQTQVPVGLGPVAVYGRRDHLPAAARRQVDEHHVHGGQFRPV